MNKMKIIYFLVGCILGCTAQKVGFLKFEPFKDGGPKYIFQTPLGYQEKRYSGDHEYQQEYWYPDSIVFYVTTFRNTYNYEQIRQQGTYYDRFEALNSNDTITLKGQDEKGFSWKDKLDGNGVTIGYSNVPPDRLDEFNKAVASLKRIK